MKYFIRNIALIFLLLIILSGCTLDSSNTEIGAGNHKSGGYIAGNKNYTYCVITDKLKKIDPACKELWCIDNFNGSDLIYDNNNIYFLDSNRYLYKLNSIDRKAAKINSKTKFYNYTINDDYIYYTDKNIGNIYKSKLDGTESKLIYKGKCKNIIINGNYIYYEDLSLMDKEKDMDKVHKRICRVNLNGKGNKILCEDDWSIITDTYYNIYEGSIFYADSNGYLCSMKNDGSKILILTNDKCSNINVYKGYVYFINESCNNELFRIKTDGTDEKKISGKCINVNIINKWIFYYDNNERKEYRTNLDGTGKIVVQ